MSARSICELFGALFAGAVLWSCFAFPALAQCYQVPNGTGGTQLYCGPSVMPQRPGGGAVQQQRTYWAAIYYDAASQTFGSSWGADSEAEAKQIALKACSNEGGHNCQMAITVRNGCVALAMATNGAWSSNSSNNSREAIANAMAVCRKNGGTDCKVLPNAHACSG